MAHRFFPDNTVLINFTLIERQDLLTWFLRDSGAWTLSISRECYRSARIAGLEAMSHWAGVFGQPIAPAPSELIHARIIADQLRSPGDTSAAAHVGEAEAIAIMVGLGQPSVFLTDDFAAARTAAAQPLVRVASTTKILALAEVADRIRHVEARALLAALSNQQRVLGNPPRIRDYDTYVRELRSRLGR